MIIDKSILIGIGVMVGIYLMYKLFFNRVKTTDDYERVYDKVLTSEEYKVKEQYDK